LHLGGAVAAGGLEVIDAEIEGAADGGLEVGLIIGGDGGGGFVAPLVLEAHAATGEDGHLEVGAAEAAVVHGKIANC